jgi:hypothetical protein
MTALRTIDLELRDTALPWPVQLRIEDHGERCLASVRCGETASRGLGATAREALVAALTPFGVRTVTALMASPAMFGASAQLLQAGDG